MTLRQYRRLAWRHICNEAVPLILERNKPPRQQPLWVGSPRAPRDRAEKHHPLNQLRTSSSKPTRHDAAPGMRNQRNPVHAMMCANKTDCLFEVTACIFGTAKRRMLFGRLRHFRIGIGETAEAVEVEPQQWNPDAASS